MCIQISIGGQTYCWTSTIIIVTKAPTNYSMICCVCIYIWVCVVQKHSILGHWPFQNTTSNLVALMMVAISMWLFIIERWAWKQPGLFRRKLCKLKPRENAHMCKNFRISLILLHILYLSVCILFLFQSFPFPICMCQRIYQIIMLWRNLVIYSETDRGTNGNERECVWDFRKQLTHSIDGYVFLYCVWA